MELNLETSENTARITLSGHVDEQGAEDLRSKLDDLDLDNIKKVVFDFTDVKRIGSAGIGQLLFLYKTLAAKEGAIRVENVAPTLLELFKGLKLDTLFTVSPA